MANAGKFLGYEAIHPFSSVDLKDRSSAQELLRTLLDPLIPHFSPLNARIKVPGGTAVRFDNSASEIEGYARPLWGLGSLLAGGGHYDQTSRWIDGLRAGTNPESPEYWGQSVSNDQRMVEMCCIGYTIAVAPVFWESLSEKERVNLENYLGGINDKDMPNTNWLWFRVFANLGLMKNGGRYSPERLVADIKHLDSFYRGDGWSNDGPEGVHMMDYYSGSFAIQFLQLLYAKLAAETDPERAKEFKSRAQQYALDFVHYSDEEGRLIPFGRSNAYRFGMIGFWAACAYADIELPPPLTWGIVKGIWLRHMRWWQTQKDIFGPSGTLTLGYSYPQVYLCENYNSPGSPYWSCLAFLCLAVPETHPFWSSAEEPYPSDFLPKIKALKHPKHINVRMGDHTYLLSSGQACAYPMKATHAKYGKFAYSSSFGYSVPPGCHTLEQYAMDSTLAFSDDEGEVWKTRRLCEDSGIQMFDNQPVLVSVWKPFRDIEVKTYLIPSTESSPNWSLRAHRISTGRDVQTAEGSYAIRNIDHRDSRMLKEYSTETLEGTKPIVIGNYDVDKTGAGTAPGDAGAFAASFSAGAVGIVALEPDTNRQAMIVNADPNSNILEKKTCIPTLLSGLKACEARWVITGVYARPAGAKVQPENFLDGWGTKPAIPQWLNAEMDA